MKISQIKFAVTFIKVKKIKQYKPANFRLKFHLQKKLIISNIIVYGKENKWIFKKKELELEELIKNTIKSLNFYIPNNKQLIYALGSDISVNKPTKNVNQLTE